MMQMHFAGWSRLGCLMCITRTGIEGYVHPQGPLVIGPSMIKYNYSSFFIYNSAYSKLYKIVLTRLGTSSHDLKIYATFGRWQRPKLPSVNRICVSSVEKLNARPPYSDQNVYHARTRAWKIHPFRGFGARKTPLFQPKSLILRSNKTPFFKAKRDFIFII